MSEVSGLNLKLVNLFAELIDKGFERGVAFVLYHEGQKVIDIAMGRSESPVGREIDSRTLFPVCSTSKGITAALINMLAMNGQVDLSRTVCSYWPEFGVNGKAGVTVREAVAHMAGIPQRPDFESFEEICDWDRTCAKIAQLEPIWTPGSRGQYHSINYGWIVGEICERATGRKFNDLLREMITGPLGISDELYFGLDAAAFGRAVHFEAQPKAKAQVTTAQAQATQVPGDLMAFVNRDDVRRACMPAVNGMMTAGAIARFYAALICEVDGVRLIDEKQLEMATTLQASENSFPRCFGHGMGLGFALKGPAGNAGAFFGHGGAGGSEGMAIKNSGISFGFTKNLYDTHIDAPNHTHWMVIKEVFDAFPAAAAADGGFYR